MHTGLEKCLHYCKSPVLGEAGLAGHLEKVQLALQASNVVLGSLLPGHAADGSPNQASQPLLELPTTSTPVAKRVMYSPHKSDHH